MSLKFRSDMMSNDEVGAFTVRYKGHCLSHETKQFIQFKKVNWRSLALMTLPALNEKLQNGTAGTSSNGLAPPPPPPTVINPEGRGRKLPPTPIRSYRVANSFHNFQIKN